MLPVVPCCSSPFSWRFIPPSLKSLCTALSLRIGLFASRFVFFFVTGLLRPGVAPGAEGEGLQKRIKIKARIPKRFDEEIKYLLTSFPRVS